MIRNQDVICFAGEDWWYHNPHSNMHIMKAMADQGNRVLFINSIGVRMPDLKRGKYALRKILNKTKSMLRYLVRAERNIFVLTPFAFPYLKGWESFIHPLNSTLVTLQLRVVLAVLKFRRPIFWVCIPTVKDIVFRLLESFQHKCLVYYCVDNISYHAGARDLNVASLETDLHCKADVAFFVNRQLISERLNVNPNTYHLEHGVDYAHFAQAQSGILPIPQDISAIPKPIVGYVGALRGLDYDLIRYLCEQNSDFAFVFIGEAHQDIPLQDLSNVHFLGKKPYDDLPGYMQAVDCLTILYKKEDVFNDYRNPKKLLEYFASGKPVVSVPILELAHFSNMVSLARGFEEFSRKLREAVLNDPPALRQQRIVYAQTHTWDDIAEKASSYIEPLLERSELRHPT